MTEESKHQKMMKQYPGIHDLFQSYLDFGEKEVIKELETHPDMEYNSENESEEMNSVMGLACQYYEEDKENNQRIFDLMKQKGYSPTSDYKEIKAIIKDKT